MHGDNDRRFLLRLEITEMTRCGRGRPLRHRCCSHKGLELGHFWAKRKAAPGACPVYSLLGRFDPPVRGAVERFDRAKNSYHPQRQVWGQRHLTPNGQVLSAAFRAIAAARMPSADGSVAA